MTLREIAGISIPDSALARDATQFIRDCESDLLFHHSLRVYCWGALIAIRRAQRFDAELLYVASMFHDIGLTARYETSRLRFEVDGANAARDFLLSRGIAKADIDTVWNAIALHTTPGIPEFMGSEIGLVQAGAGMDVAGRGYDTFTDAQREAVTAAFPREADFKHGIIDAFYQGMKHRPETTVGTFNDDVLAYKDPKFQRSDICRAILASSWKG
jgi:hypothetical protein